MSVQPLKCHGAEPKATPSMSPREDSNPNLAKERKGGPGASPSSKDNLAGLRAAFPTLPASKVGRPSADGRNSSQAENPARRCAASHQKPKRIRSRQGNSPACPAPSILRPQYGPAYFAAAAFSAAIMPQVAHMAWLMPPKLILPRMLLGPRISPARDRPVITVPSSRSR